MRANAYEPTCRRGPATAPPSTDTTKKRSWQTYLLQCRLPASRTTADRASPSRPHPGPRRRRRFRGNVPRAMTGPARTSTGTPTISSPSTWPPAPDATASQGRCRCGWWRHLRGRSRRDVAYDEDRSQVRTGNGPASWPVCDLAIAILRLTGHASVAAALHYHARRPSRPTANNHARPKTTLPRPWGC
jgi:hypothetical protein